MNSTDAPSGFALEYATLESIILDLRAKGMGPALDAVEEPLLERMDVLWLRMTDEERQVARRRCIAWRESRAVARIGRLE